MKVTKENFNEFIKKHTTRKSFDYFLKGIKLPNNNEEFNKITEELYGVRLNVSCLAYPINSFGKESGYSCKYEIVEKQDNYCKGSIYKLWDEHFGQYDGLKVLLNSCFGVLSCGGVAGSHYGQTKCDKKTWERIKNWDSNNDNKIIENQIEQHNSLVDIFGFNPFLR